MILKFNFSSGVLCYIIVQRHDGFFMECQVASVTYPKSGWSIGLFS